jgi:HEPN domain-containing protein
MGTLEKKKIDTPSSSIPFDWQTRHFYLIFADEDYLAARALVLIGMARAAGVLGEQAVEKYIKLNLMEHGIKPPFIKPTHDLPQLFKFMENHLAWKGKDGTYYAGMLKTLFETFEYKYFDDRGLKGALQKSGRVSVGVGLDHLGQFDELCMELRNNNTCDSGATPIYKAAQLNKPWFNEGDLHFALAFNTKNNFRDAFKVFHL